MRRDGDDPGLPIKLGPCSNGEYAPIMPGPVVREAARRVQRDAAAHARRLGISRREFLLSSMGAATTLLALTACSKESRSDGEGAGGSFDVPPDATTDPDVATSTLDAGSPVIDLQTHLLEYDPADERSFGLGFPQAGCGEANPRDCFDTAHWLDEVFARSDTTVAVLSAVPILAPPDPLSEQIMDAARRQVDDLCGDGRVLIEGHAFPNTGLEATLEGMTAVAGELSIAAWKAYTHVGTPYRLDDATGDALLDHIESLRDDVSPILCVHKGFGADPADVGPAAVAHPDVTFIVYHSGFEGGVGEGAFDPADPNDGVDRLLVSLRDAGIEPGGNVCAELGSTWRSLMGNPDAAAHVLGKLLIAVGEDNVVWGTDSIWYGSPQDQIQAMRSFQISEEWQERFGYPALTSEIKEKIFWRNAARLLEIDPAGAPCATTSDEREEARRASPHGNAVWGPQTARAARARFAREHPWLDALRPG